MIALALSAAMTLAIVYTITMFFVGTRTAARLAQRRPIAEADDPSPVRLMVVVPCLNEELVIGRTVERLLAIDDTPGFEPIQILVIDDGSDDRTAEIASSYDPTRVTVFRRQAPNAREGKGVALNAAFRWLRDVTRDAGDHPDTIVLGVLDADGRLDPAALGVVGPMFADPRLGAVQLKVLIHNAPDGLLPRLQDVEFATFTEVFQRARAQLGSSGLGGNGQFTRLSALMDLGDDPWSDCLTEDLELGINLLMHGWTNAFVPDTAVSQQGVTELRRLIRQRSRWFQGHLQCLGLMPRVIRSCLPIGVRLDLCYHLVSSLIMLFFQTLALVWLAGLVVASVRAPAAVGSTLSSPTRLAILYLLAFGISPLVALAYRRARPEEGLLRCLLIAHAYVIYTYMWWGAGLSALARHLRGERGWAKTARTVGTGDESATNQPSGSPSPLLPSPVLDPPAPTFLPPTDQPLHQGVG